MAITQENTNGLSKSEDMPALLMYLIEYAADIEAYKEHFDFNDKHVQKFLEQKGIFTGSYNQKNIAKSRKFDRYLLFEQNKNSKKSGSDVAHHLLRHIRNSIAHANIKKVTKKVDGQTKQFFLLEDFRIDSKSQTMKGWIESKLLYELVDLLKSTKR